MYVCMYACVFMGINMRVEERICWFFADEPTIEDELHFMFNCCLYTQERQEFIEHCKPLNQALPNLTNIDKWEFISHTNNKQLIYSFSKLISVAFGERRAHL